MSWLVITEQKRLKNITFRRFCNTAKLVFGGPKVVIDFPRCYRVATKAEKSV